ncbi:hypothetical protein [Ruegeria sp. HKCCD6428]|uniref:hypothetical protein n=1 Tax=Ruegeria sp. HKCCD6428 TaxID=2683002 RepID=UPI001490FF7A|nr:hypothetical protein [Ruegeria sp. HKCCD6428]NOC84433.1 hypothetical protein [Ruegeria sp. HKCCD6428]
MSHPFMSPKQVTGVQIVLSTPVSDFVGGRDAIASTETCVVPQPNENPTNCQGKSDGAIV